MRVPAVRWLVSMPRVCAPTRGIIPLDQIPKFLDGSLLEIEDVNAGMEVLVREVANGVNGYG